MKFQLQIRLWHRWVSVILALPILVVALTAVVMTHRKALGTDDLALAPWLSGNASQAAKANRVDARASLVAANGDTYVAIQNSLYRLAGDRLLAVDELAGAQVRGLAEAAWGKVAAARTGIWLEQDGHWQKVASGDAWNASLRPDGTVAVALRDQGLLVSGDGRNWQPDPRTAGALANLPPGAAEPLTLARWVLDLHTGRVFLGREREWVWVDVVGATLCLLALTGIYMWWRSQRRKPAVRPTTAGSATPPR